MSNILKVNNNILLSNGSVVKTDAVDVSDTTAVESDVASGKKFYKADGTAGIGTVPSGRFTINSISRAASDTRSGCPKFQGCWLPEYFELDIPYCRSFDSAFGVSSSWYSCGIKNCKKLVVNGPSTPMATSLYSMFGRLDDSGTQGVLVIEEITLNFDMSLVSDYRYFIMNNTLTLQAIYCNFNFSSVTSASSLANMFAVNAPLLTHLRFVPNTLSFSLSLAGASTQRGLSGLDNDSLVSAANCLKEDVTGQTITFHAAPKSRLSTIMGTVTMDSGNTYHIFTADATGSTALQDFITQTKGWTIA